MSNSWDEWCVIHDRHVAEAKEQLAAAVVAHRELVESATGLRRAVLDMHGPQMIGDAVCESCEEYDEGNQPFPCPTYILARDWEDTND